MLVLALRPDNAQTYYSEISLAAALFCGCDHIPQWPPGNKGRFAGLLSFGGCVLQDSKLSASGKRILHMSTIPRNSQNGNTWSLMSS